MYNSESQKIHLYIHLNLVTFATISLEHIQCFQSVARTALWLVFTLCTVRGLLPKKYCQTILPLLFWMLRFNQISIAIQSSLLERKKVNWLNFASQFVLLGLSLILKHTVRYRLTKVLYYNLTVISLIQTNTIGSKICFYCVFLYLA